MTLHLRRFRGKVRPTPPALIDLQATRHHPACKVHTVGSNAPRYCTCGLARSRVLAGDRSTR